MRDCRNGFTSLVGRWLAPLCIALVASCLSSGNLHAQQPRRPNVVMILTDDQGWGDLSINGNTNLRTPHIDSLAGAAPSSIASSCSPSVRRRGPSSSPAATTPAAACAASPPAASASTSTRGPSPRSSAPRLRHRRFGKWHNGTQYPYHPNARGFDEYYGFTSGHWGDYFDPPLEHNGKPVRGEGYITDDLTDQAIAFIDKNRAGRSSATCRSTRRTRRCRCRTSTGIAGRTIRSGSAARTARPRTSRSRAAPWRCARTSTGTSAACWRSSTS